MIEETSLWGSGADCSVKKQLYIRNKIIKTVNLISINTNSLTKVIKSILTNNDKKVN